PGLVEVVGAKMQRRTREYFLLDVADHRYVALQHLMRVGAVDHHDARQALETGQKLLELMRQAAELAHGQQSGAPPDTVRAAQQRDERSVDLARLAGGGRAGRADAVVGVG